MKKFIKNNLLGFILGVIIGSGTLVFAEYVVTADKVEYTNNVSVKDKIDDLYTKVKPNYTGSVEVTPTSSSQTLSTNGKILNSNITINPIPANFHELSNQANVTSNSLLSGYKGYNGNGELITGNLSTNCVSGSYVVQALNKQLIISGFSPSTFTMYMPNQALDVYISSLSSNKYFSLWPTTSSVNGEWLSINNVYVFENNSLFLGSAWNDNSIGVIGKTLYYTACR